METPKSSFYAKNAENWRCSITKERRSEKSTSAHMRVSFEFMEPQSTGARLIVAVYGLNSGISGLDKDGTVLWNLKSNIDHFDAIKCPTKPWIALTSFDGFVQVVDINSGKEIAIVDAVNLFREVTWTVTSEGVPLLALLVMQKGQTIDAYRVEGE